MKRICLFFALLVLLGGTSCVTLKKCTEKFHIVSSVTETIKYRDTTVYLTVQKTDTVYGFGNLVDTIIVSSGTAHGMTFIKHDTLKLYVWQSDSSYKFKLDSVIKELMIEKSHIVTIVDKPKIYKILWQVLAGLAIVAFIILIPRILKKKN
jgi:hypothetical protein